MKRKLVLKKKLYIDTKQKFNFFFYFFLINFRKQTKIFYYFNMKFFNFLLFFYKWNIFFLYHKFFNLYDYLNILLPKNFKKFFILALNSFFKLDKSFFIFFNQCRIYGDLDFSNCLITHDLKFFKSSVFKNKYFMINFNFTLFFIFYYNYLNKQYYDFLNFCYLKFLI